MSIHEERFDAADEIDDIGAEGWLFSYADMMTLLFGFFVMLYALAMENQGQIDQRLKEMAPLVRADGIGTGSGRRDAVRPASEEKNPLFVDMEKRLKEQNEKLLALTSLHERAQTELRISEDKVQSLTVALNELQLAKVSEETKAKQSAVRAVREQDIQQLNQNLALATAEKLKLLGEKRKAEDQIASLNRNLLEIQKEKAVVAEENTAKSAEIVNLDLKIDDLTKRAKSLEASLKQKEEAVTKLTTNFYNSQNEHERLRNEKRHIDQIYERTRKENESLVSQMKRLEGIKSELEQSLVILELEKKNRERPKKSPASVPSR